MLVIAILPLLILPNDRIHDLDVDRCETLVDRMSWELGVGDCKQRLAVSLERVCSDLTSIESSS
jgi:hypothetical protein